MTKKNCMECSRHDLIQALKELEEQVPYSGDNDGFGEDEKYVDGLVGGIAAHIKGVVAELELMDKEVKEFGKVK